MADNVATSPAVAGGEKIATDEVGTSPNNAHYQRIKVDGGAEGNTAPILGDSANGLDVDVTRTPKISAAGVGDGSPKTVPDSTATPAGVRLAASVDTRRRIEVINASSVTVYLRLGANADLDSNWQIPLSAGQSWWDDIYTGEVWATHVNPGSTVQVGVIVL